MTSKFLLFASMCVTAQAGVFPVGPIAPIGPIAYNTEFDPNPQYSYAYDVQDALTGDSKSQFETRSGDIVTGQYSLIDSDGTRRIVDYVADPINGFNAAVRKEPLVAAAPAPIVAAPPAPFVAAGPAPIVAAPGVTVARTVAAPSPLGYAPAPLPYGPAISPYAKFSYAF